MKFYNILIAGDDDNMWQSEIAAENIYNKRTKNTEVFIYEGAGHIFVGDRFMYTSGMTLDMGGNKEANEKAFTESNKVIMDKLSEWH